MSSHDLQLTQSTMPGSAAQAPDSVRRQLSAGLPVTERTLPLNGVVTTILEGGSGPPIVLLHGPAAYGASWIHVIPDLVTSHRVIAPDLPGHGASGTFDGTPTIDRACGWLDDLIQRTCHVPPTIVGHTLGGSVAVHYASAHGERVASLILVDTLGLVPFQPKPAFGAALEAFLSAPTGDTLEGLWTDCLFDRSSVKRRLGERWTLMNGYILERMQATDGLAGLVGLMDHFGLPAIPSTTLARIATPTTLIWGRQDRATPLAVAEEASARFGWPLHVIEEAADDPTLDQPEAFLSVLRRVLNGA